MLNDLRLAVRRILHQPAFSAVVVLTLALGIGANTAILSTINATFLRALPFPDPDRLVHLEERNATGEDISISYPNFLDWRAAQDAFTALACFKTEGAKLRTPAGAEKVDAVLMSAGFFEALCIRPALGRPFLAADDEPGAPQVAWLTDALWREHFGADTGIIGTTIVIDDHAVTVAGILPPAFSFLRKVDLYRPIGPLAASRVLNERENHPGLNAIGRLRDGVTLAQARACFDAIGRRLAEDFPTANAGLAPGLESLRERVSGHSRTQLFLLLGGVLLLLVVACVNIANLLLARAQARGREMAIRTAIGASRHHLVRQLLAESLMLSVAGGALGFLIGSWATSLTGRLVPWEVANAIGRDAGLDGTLVAMVAGLTLLTGLAFGLAPAWLLSHAHPVDALKGVTAAHPARLAGFRVTDILVGAQVALAVILLVGAGLLSRSLDRLGRVNPGFDPDNLLTFDVSSPPLELFSEDPLAAHRFSERILDGLRALPEVRACAAGTSIPFTWDESTMVFYKDSEPVPAPGKYPAAHAHFVTADYFTTMGIPVLTGRVFDNSEEAPPLPKGQSLSVEALATVYNGVTIDAVISRSMAEKFWPGGDALGRRFRLGFENMGLPWARIVGIVGDTTQMGLERGHEPEFYLSMRQLPLPFGRKYLVRTRTDAAAASAAIRASIRESAPGEPMFDVRTMTARMDLFSQGRRFNRGLHLFFACTALLLSATGLYGVLAFRVGQRAREFGIRRALGAPDADIARQVLAHGARLVVPGIVGGTLAAFWLTRFLQAELYGVVPSDPVTYAGATSVLTVAAAIACFLPARRAARVDPAIALRDN